jgi:ABC-2 type transport system permease protein
MSTPATTPAAAQSRTLGAPALAWLVARREIVTQVRSRAFIASTALFVVLIAAGVLLSSWLGGGGIGSADDDASDAPLKVAAGPGLAGLDALQKADLFQIVDAADDQAAVAAVTAGEADAAVVAGPAGGAPYGVVAVSEAPAVMIDALTVSPAVQLLDPEPLGPAMGYVVSLAFGVLFLWAAMMFGQTIAQNTVIEKQTRIVEILLAAVPARALLAGKVVGHSILALGETALMAATAIICLQITGNSQILDVMTAPMLWYVVFFTVGFVLLASLFAGTASLVSRLEDVSTAIMPLTMLVMVPYILILTLNDNPAAMQVMSYIPIVSTIAMPVRMVLGATPWWEAVVALVILIATTFGAILVGAKVYANSLLQTDRKLKFLTALRAKD